MSGPFKNVQRDGIYSEHLATNYVGWGTGFDLTLPNGPGIATVLPSVAVDYGCVHSSRAATVFAADTGRAIGVAIQQPLGDRTPYRVKVGVLASGATDWAGTIMVGFGPTDLSTGVNIQVDAPRYYPTSDDLIIVENQESGDLYYDRPLIIALVLVPPRPETVSVVGFLNVQNLGLKPPTMQNAVS